MNKTQWHGIIPPLVTPLKDNDTLDIEALERLVNHVITGGVHGIFLLGTTGEGPSLSRELKYRLVEEACRIVNHRVPLLAGITDTSFTESIALANHAALHGADAVVAAPPYYMPPSQPELLDYIKHLAPKLPLPLFLYNMPAMTKVNIDVDTVKRAADIPNVIGIKDSSCSMIYVHELIDAMKNRDFPVLIGPEEMLGESVLLGAQGGVNGGANILPALYVSMYHAAESGDAPRMRKLQADIMRLREIYRVGHYASSGIKGIKCALSIMGICGDYMAEPFQHFYEPERERVAQILAALR
ncbi:MAG: dihydrodipicolinate synthase family protein [Spirochaetes bacterium]|nr:dihydrodipicolinate synthase family protein [Spirochaetota bacterium]